MMLRDGFALALAAVLAACSSSTTGGDAGIIPGADAGPDAGSDAGPDAGADAGGNPGNDGGFDAGIDAGTGDDGGVVVTFDVPAAGGSVQVTGSQVYTFEFPPDVGGQSFTIQVLPPTSFGFDAGYFADLFKLGPNGTQFTTPVRVVPATQTNLPHVAFLYPEPVVPVGAEIVFMADGGYPLHHFSAFGMPGSPAGFCNPAYQARGGVDACLPYTWVANQGYVAGDPVDMPGYTNVYLDPCFQPDTCMAIYVDGCTTVADATAYQNDPNEWCPGVNPPFGYTEVEYQACPAAPPPPGCVAAVGFISPLGCHFRLTCAGTVLNLTCDGTNCSCTGGSGATFPQGGACANTSNGMAALAQKCP